MGVYFRLPLKYFTLPPALLMKVGFVCILAFWVSTSYGAAYFVGAKKCAECHEAEVKVWEGTKHFKSFREVHKLPEAKKIVEAVGGKDMKSTETCAICHFTLEQKDEQAKPLARTGPSCESCHGAASEWIAVHNDYGGENVKKEQETPQHKKDRIASTQKAGMLWPTMPYDLAARCMSCHGLARSELDAATLAKMLDAKHPFKPEYEFIQYSQGTVRHRYYPPNVTDNAQMTPAELSRWFVIGQAAKLVSATAAMNKSDHPVYKDGQKKRAELARVALTSVKDVPEIAAFLADPSEANARKLAAAVEKQDLSAKVKALLPAKDTYK
jgi:Cytochrome c554 and c-prime